MRLEATEFEKSRAFASPVGFREKSGENTPLALSGSRPTRRGKFLFVEQQKLYVRGVTYGTFRPDDHGDQFPPPPVVAKDFAQMAARGINAIRTYTVPPRWLLDLAWQSGLLVMVGMWWEQHVAFLDDVKSARKIEQHVRASVRKCAGHSAVLGYAIGNEISASIVRWHGHRRVERFLRRLYDAAKEEDPASQVTYVNFPSTEYLRLPFLDLACFNVYLESEETLEAYLARLQNLAGERPLILSESGLDSRRNGELTQAQAVNGQIRTSFAAGCAGIFVFAWTDEWYCGAWDINDWDFGLTRRDRSPKPALTAVRRAFEDVPFPRDREWPHISVVVCTYNGKHAIRDCLSHLHRLDYPNFEVVVVSDGSNDGTVALARGYGFRVITGPNRGLSAARNAGLHAARAEIVAYIDDDAYPDPHWLHYLAHAFMTTSHAGIGGPNLPPPEDGLIARSVANSPGGPNHVLVTDTVAEHIPGCNMAYRKECLEAVGGFDPQFRIAGDDVDICWRLQQRGWTLGFSPAAMVWHHRRNSVRAYLRQQKNYGRAEALLERKWPEKYNRAGHLSWAGRIYGNGHLAGFNLLRNRIYHGPWGGAPFQSLYQPGPSPLESLVMMPESYLLIGLLGLLMALGMSWAPALWFAPLFAVGVAAVVGQAILGSVRAKSPEEARRRTQRWKLFALTAFLHLAQPAVRLWGRASYGLAPLRLRDISAWVFPRPRTVTIWSEGWKSAAEWLESLASTLQANRARIWRGGEYDRWDLQVSEGLIGGARVLMTVEEHGAGRQHLRFKVWPEARLGLIACAIPALLAAWAVLDGAWIAAAAFGAMALGFAGAALLEPGISVGRILAALDSVRTRNGLNPSVEIAA